MLRGLIVTVLGGILMAAGLHAETGYKAWLRYAALDEAASRQYREALPAVVTTAGESVIIDNARQELIRGIRGMLGRTLRVEAGVPAEGAIVVGTLAEIRKAAPQFALAGTTGAEGSRTASGWAGSGSAGTPRTMPRRSESTA